MRTFLSALAIVTLAGFVSAQSGRRAREITVPVPPPIPQQPDVPPKAPPHEAPVTAERNQDYRCTDDGTLERVLESNDDQNVFSSKQVDTRLVITAKPQPSYTKEARRLGVQGFVVLKTLMSSDSKVARVRVVKGLPAGLTENAIRAACKMKFKPAIKAGQPVAQWVTAEYVFRLAHSSIFGP